MASKNKNTKLSDKVRKTKVTETNNLNTKKPSSAVLNIAPQDLLRAARQKFKEWKATDPKTKRYRSFRLQKRIKPEPRYIPSSFSLLRDSFAFMFKHRWKFITIMFIYSVVYIVIFRSPVSTDIDTIKSSVQSVLGEGENLKTNVATLGAVIETSGNLQSSGAVAVGSIFIMSLVYIWAIRQLHAGERIKARDAYYQGVTPLLSGAVLVIIAGIQLLPFGLASFIYSVAKTTNLFASGFEDIAFFVVTVLISLLSFYWLTSTIMAMYIVTIPGVYPGAALKAAKSLVQFQRFAVFRRILALPVILGVIYTIFLLIAIRFLSSQVLLMVEIIQIIALPLIHVYLYKLYRSLI